MLAFVPEENFASTEHDLIQEVTAPLSSLREDSEPELDETEFPLVLRGYDRLAVDAYVKQARQTIEELRATRSPDAAVRRALERVGEEVSGILQRAHDTAEKITGHSRSEAEDRLETARREAEKLKAGAEGELEAARRDAVEIRAAAERQLTGLDAETDRIWAERHRIVEDARELARQLLELADAAAERFPPADDTETGETILAEEAGDEVGATAILPLPEELSDGQREGAGEPELEPPEG